MDGNQSNEKQSFGFSLSNVDADGPQGSFECIRQGKNRIMENFGNMHYKLQIHASEDSYQKTKVKMAVVEQESKKNCTKVIKASGPNVGRKVKVKRSGNASNLIQQPSYSRPSSPPSLKVNGSCVTNTTNRLNNSSNSSTISNSINKSPNSNCSSFKADVMRKPMKERVIHLLAIRPYKKPEILMRLMKDGIKDKDKKGLTLLLSQIAMLKDNAYYLAKHAWQEVQIEEWPFYTNEERDLVRKRHPNLQVQSGSPQSENSLAFSSPGSANGVNSPSLSPNNAYKRTVDSTSFSSKKARISHSNFRSLPLRSKSPSERLQTSGYNDVLNGWAKKPSSPDAMTSTTSVSKVNYSSFNNCTTDLRPADSSQSKTNHPSPDSNGIVLPQSSQTQRQNGMLSNGATHRDNIGTTPLKPSNKTNVMNRPYRHNGTTPHLVTSTTNGSVNSTPNSSPDSGTGSHDGSASVVSSKSSYSINGDIPDYQM